MDPKPAQKAGADGPHPVAPMGVTLQSVNAKGGVKGA
jgi:hypothetical protein